MEQLDSRRAAGKVFLIRTDNSYYLLYWQGKTSGLVYVLTTNKQARLDGWRVVGWCDEHHNATPAIKVGERMCLGEQANVTARRAAHTSRVSSIEPIEGATFQNDKFILPVRTDEPVRLARNLVEAVHL